MCEAGMPMWGGLACGAGALARRTCFLKLSCLSDTCCSLSWRRNSRSLHCASPSPSEGEAPVETTVQGGKEISVLFAVVLRLRKHRSSGFMNIRLGKHPHAIESGLQFGLI